MQKKKKVEASLEAQKCQKKYFLLLDAVKLWEHGGFVDDVKKAKLEID